MVIEQLDTKTLMMSFPNDSEIQVKNNKNKVIQCTDRNNSGETIRTSEIIFSEALKKVISLLGKSAERKITLFFANSLDFSENQFFANYQVAQKTLPLIFGLKNTRTVLNAVIDEIQKNVDLYTSEPLADILKKIDNGALHIKNRA